MKKICITLIVFVLAILAKESLLELIRASDHFFKRGEFHDALLQIRKAESIAPDEAEVLWRIGMIYNRIAMHLIGKEQIDTFKTANEYLSKALRLNKRIARIHSEMAWNLTYMALLGEEVADFAIARRIKEEIDYALSLDEKIADAYFIYGLWHRQVSQISILKRKPNGLGDANNDSALSNFQKAFEIDSNSALFGLELANQYLINGDTLSAISMFHKVLEMPIDRVNKPYMEKAQSTLFVLEPEK